MQCEVNCSFQAGSKEDNATHLQLSIAIWRCENGAANSSDFSGEARNMDLHVKFPDFLNYCVCQQSVHRLFITL